MKAKSSTGGLYVPPPVLVDEAAGWAWVHQSTSSTDHTLDAQRPDQCDIPGCTPQRSALKGGDETPDDLKPPLLPTPVGQNAVACRHAGCEVTAIAETPELALTAMTRHGRDAHGEV